MLDIFSKAGLKVTIAHVGAMGCEDLVEWQNSTPPNLPNYSWSKYSSYNLFHQFSALANAESLFFCKSFLNELKGMENVELASHTYSHYYCLEEGQTLEEFDADLAMASSKALGKYTSIVFPRNQVSDSYLSICKKYGFTHYRSIYEDFIHKAEQTKSHFSLKGALRLLDAYLPLTGNKTFVGAIDHDGIKEVYGSMFLRPYSNKLRFIEPLKVWRVKRAMTYAAHRGECFHLWWHPHNFGANTEKNLSQLKEICNHFVMLHDEYGMKASFMNE